MKKVTLLTLTLTLILTLSTITNAFAKIDLRSESENTTIILRNSIPQNSHSYLTFNYPKFKTNYDIYNRFQGYKDKYDAPEYFHSIIDAYIVAAQMGDTSIHCLKEATPQLRADIAQVYKDIINEGIIKMNDSAAIGIYQVIRLICDIKAELQSQYPKNIKQLLEDKYL